MLTWVRWTSAAVWIFCWRTIYLEVFRWHHMTKTLRFNPPPPAPAMPGPAKAGFPLVAVCVGSVVAPLVFVAATVAGRLRGNAHSVPRRGGRRAGGRWWERGQLPELE